MYRFRDERGFRSWNCGVGLLGPPTSTPTRLEEPEDPGSCQSAGNTMQRVDKLLMRLEMKTRLRRKMSSRDGWLLFPLSLGDPGFVCFLRFVRLAL